MIDKKTSFSSNIETKNKRDLPKLDLIPLPPIKIRIKPRIREIYLSPSLPSKDLRCLRSRQKTK